MSLLGFLACCSLTMLALVVIELSRIRSQLHDIEKAIVRAAERQWSPSR